MKVLFACSEASPIVKVGGLGDVAGALPKALENLGVDVDVIIPFYSVIDQAKFKIIKQLTIEVPYANATHNVDVYKTKLPNSNVDVFLLGDRRYLSDGGSQAFTSLKDEIERFSFFDRSVVEFIKAQFNVYDLVHCNDWHTGVITHLLEEEIGDERPATLFTIHNVSYQGQWSLELVQELGLTIPLHQVLQWDLEDGNINFMQEGIASSDAVSTVSPTYAKEIMFSDIGGQMADILKGKSGRVFGILNGIDYDSYNPETDKNLFEKFSVKSLEKKKLNKEKLQKELSLHVKNIPVFSIISRIDPNQKGFDIFSEMIEKMLEMDLQIIILGKGDKGYEEKFTNLSKDSKYKGKISVNIGFDEGLARKIYAGSDVFLMPSRTEPCGLAQMIAMRYGALPIVHETGGLKDTVKDEVDGFSFNIFKSSELLKCVTRAFKLYGSEKWQSMIKNAMKKDFSWKNSAIEYKELYEKVVNYRK